MARLRRVTVPGRRAFEYVSQGDGPATLLVHAGGPGLTYQYLRGLLKLANSNLRVILFNPRGVGHSWTPRRPQDYTIANMAEDVEAIRQSRSRTPTGSLEETARWASMIASTTGRSRG